MRRTIALVCSALLSCCAHRPAPAFPPGPAGAEPFITVLGQVNRPDRVPSTAPRPLCELVAIAGGPTALACRLVTLSRTVGGRRQRWAITVESLRDGDGCRVSAWPGDTLLVGSCGD